MSQREIPWQNYVFTAVTIPSYPLYCWIVGMVIWRRRTNTRYQTTFYSLLISLGMADLLAMAQTFLIQIIRTSYIATDFYWINRGWIASISYNFINFTVYLRCFGATLLAYQRYIIVCWGSNFALARILQLPFLLVLAFHWIPPFLLSLPITVNWTKTFAAPDDMTLLVSSDQSQWNTMSQGITVAVLFLLCLFPYIQIFRLLWHIRNSQNRNIGREARLSIIPLGQSICFLVIFFCYLGVYLLTLAKNPFLETLRLFMLLVNALLSYWNPWVYLALNSDIQNEFKRVFFKTGVPIVSPYCIKTNQMAQNTVTQGRASQVSSQPRHLVT